MATQKLSLNSSDCSKLELKGLQFSPYYSVPQELIQEHRPDFIFLSETKRNNNSLQPLDELLGYPSSFEILACNNNSGGLCLLWNNTTDIDVDTMITMLNTYD